MDMYVTRGARGGGMDANNGPRIPGRRLTILQHKGALLPLAAAAKPLLVQHARLLNLDVLAEIIVFAAAAELHWCGSERESKQGKKSRCFKGARLETDETRN